MGMFSGCIRSFKRFIYTTYCQLEVDTGRTSISRRQLVLQKRISYAVGITYLLMCTFYIFLYAVKVQDNEVVSSVLMSVAFSDGLEVLVTGPCTMVMTAGLFPMLAVGLVSNDIRKILAANQRKHDAKRHDDEDEVDFSHGGGMVNPIFDQADYHMRGSENVMAEEETSTRQARGMQRQATVKQLLFGADTHEVEVEVDVARSVEVT
jgi:hypothetical protein